MAVFINSFIHVRVLLLHTDPNQVMAMQGMGDEEAMVNLAIALSLNEVHTHWYAAIMECICTIIPLGLKP